MGADTGIWREDFQPINVKISKIFVTNTKARKLGDTNIQKNTLPGFLAVRSSRTKPKQFVPPKLGQRQDETPSEVERRSSHLHSAHAARPARPDPASHARTVTLRRVGPSASDHVIQSSSGSARPIRCRPLDRAPHICGPIGQPQIGQSNFPSNNN